MIAKLEKAKVRVATLDPVEADTPADTKLLKKSEKELEVPAARVLTYSALPAHPVLGMWRKKRDVVTKVRAVHGLGAVEADTPASTGLLAHIVTEHEVAMPRMVYMI